MEYQGYAVEENNEWILKIHEGDGFFSLFFKGEKLQTYHELVNRISEISGEMGWYEVQYKKDDDGRSIVTIFYDVIYGD